MAGFFMNVDQEILYRLLTKKIKREDVLWLARVIIFHDCTVNYRFKGNQRLLGRIPPHKTLFKVGPHKGLPIGNLSSQFFANVYLNELDQFIKRRLRCRYYLRYCDDVLLLDPSPERLAEWRMAIEGFLRGKLQLRPNEQQDRLRPVSSGIDFLGYIVRRRYVLARRRVVNHFKEKLVDFETRLGETSIVSGKGREITTWQYPAVTMDALRAVTASYLGHFSWADTHHLVKGFFATPVLRAAFILNKGRLIPRYALPGKKETLRIAYGWWTREEGIATVPYHEETLYPLWIGKGLETKVLIFFPVGRFYEFYGDQAKSAKEILGLKFVTGLRGFQEGCGFHRRLLGRYLGRARNAGYHVALIQAERGLDGKVRRRLARLFRSHAPVKEVVSLDDRGDTPLLQGNFHLGG